MHEIEMTDKTLKTNLLIDSLSEDSDVPDLELIPPTKISKRKKLKFPRRTNSSRIPSEDVIGVVPSRCWTLTISFVLFSLVLAFSLLGWFTFGIYRELERLKASLPTEITSKFEQTVTIDKRLKTLEEKWTDYNNTMGSKIDNFTQDQINMLQNKLSRLDAQMKTLNLTLQNLQTPDLPSTELEKKESSENDENSDQKMAVLENAIKLTGDLTELEKKQESEIQALKKRLDSFSTCLTEICGQNLTGVDVERASVLFTTTDATKQRRRKGPTLGPVKP